MILSCQNVEKAFLEKQVIKNCSFHIEEHEKAAIVGINGAGKTTLVGGVAKGLGIDEPVLSPTFNIMKCYFHSPLSLYHIDAYRLEGQNIEIGLDEYIEGDGACFIEWPSYIADLIPDEHLEIEIRNLGGDSREVRLSAKGHRYEQMLEELAK